MDWGCCWKRGAVAVVVVVLVFLGLSGVVLGADGLSGKAVWETNACTACHGPSGDGGLGPSLKGAEFKQKYANVDKMVEVIRVGRGTMPGFTEQRIDREQMDTLVGFILNLSKSSPGDKGDEKGDLPELHFGLFSVEQLYGLAVMVLGIMLLIFYAAMLNGPFKARR